MSEIASTVYTPELLRKTTNDCINNIKQDVDVYNSISFLEQNYSGSYLHVLRKYNVDENDKREYIDSKRYALYKFAKTFDQDKEVDGTKLKFSAWVYKNGKWYLSGITNNFYKKKEIVETTLDEPFKLNLKENFVLPKSHLAGDVERIILENVEKLNKPSYYSKVLILKLIYNYTYEEIAEEFKSTENEDAKVNSKQRVHQIFQEMIKPIRVMLNKELNLKKTV